MKKTALTMVISSLLLAGTAQAATVYEQDGSKLDVYGRIVGLNYFTSESNSDQGDQSYARVGVRGETQLAGGWTAFAKAEKQLDANQDEHMRHLHAGATNEQFGTVTYGRQFGLFYTHVAAYTDMLMEFGNDGLGDGADKFGTGRNSGLLTYVYENSGLSLGAQATFANHNSESFYGSEEKGSEEGYALAAGYDFGNGFALSAAYNEAEKTREQHSAIGGDDNAKLAGVAMKYSNDGLYAAVSYAQGQDHLYVSKFNSFAEDHKGLEAVVQYNFTPEFLFGVAYIQTDAEDTRANFDGTVNQYTSVHGSYSFKPNFFLYADYKINMLDDSDADTFKLNTDDTFALGLQYNF